MLVSENFRHLVYQPSHTKQQKTFLGTLGTQDYTSIGSKTSLGPSMDPTGPLKWTL